MVLIALMNGTACSHTKRDCQIFNSICDVDIQVLQLAIISLPHIAKMAGVILPCSGCPTWRDHYSAVLTKAPTMKYLTCITQACPPLPWCAFTGPTPQKETRALSLPSLASFWRCQTQHLLAWCLCFPLGEKLGPR